MQSLELSKVQKLAKEIIDPQKMTWLVVGDSKKIIAEIKALGYGEVIAIDSDGNVLQPQSQKLDVEGGKN